MNESHPLDLHSELQNDTSGARRADLLAQLRGLQEKCMAAKRQLSDREAYHGIQAAAIAVNAAIKIVETLPQPRAAWN
jgi:hypothetical protein